MDKLKAMESFVSVATRGSLTAAAQAEGVAPAIMGRRLDALEERLGVKLLVRTTRRITLTHEGSAFLEDCQRLLVEFANAEASVSAGGVKASGYLRQHGTPQHPAELARFDCLTLSSGASQSRGWAFRVPITTGERAGESEVVHLKPGGPLDCTDGQVLHDWCLAGGGIAWRSTWEVQSDIASGRLVELLADFAAPPNGIYAVFAQRRHLPLRVRLWIDFLKHSYDQPGYWQSGA